MKKYLEWFENPVYNKKVRIIGFLIDLDKAKSPYFEIITEGKRFRVLHVDPIVRDFCFEKIPVKDEISDGSKVIVTGQLKSKNKRRKEDTLWADEIRLYPTRRPHPCDIIYVQ